MRAARCSSGRQHVARDEPHAGEQRHALDYHQGDLLGDAALALGTDRGERDDRADHHQVLHDQDAHRDPAVQLVDLATVRQQLDDDDRARERQRHRDVGGGHDLQAEQQREAEAERRR